MKLLESKFAVLHLSALHKDYSFDLGADKVSPCNGTFKDSARYYDLGERSLTQTEL